jgi:hypothetical protein
MLQRLILSLPLLLAFALPASATPSFGNSAPWNAVVTYQSIGLYWKPDGVTSGKATVRFRKQGTSTWREGHELWWDDRNDEFRGSLVELDHNSIYEIQLKAGTGAWSNTTASCNTASEQECQIPATSSCSSANRTQCTRTWNNDYPVKEVRSVTSRDSMLVITDGGNETEGYIVYEGADGDNTLTAATESGADAQVNIAADTFTIPSQSGKWTTGMPVTLELTSGSITGPNPDGREFYLIVVNPTTVKLATSEANALNNVAINLTAKSAPVWSINGACVQVDADFVVVRNLVLDGCPSHAIRLHSAHSAPSPRAANDVIIEDNEIRGWGRVRPATNPPLAFDGDAAVFCNNAGETAHGDHDDDHRSNRIVVQRNNIHNPRHTAEPWRASEGADQTHPHGAVAMSFISCGSNHVVRWNDVHSTQVAQEPIKYFKDGFGGAPDLGEPGDDTGVGGFPWADSDIYGNRIMHTYDDAIESEGMNRNVRIWGNYFDRVFMAIGTAATATGPLYVWRNVTHWMGDMACPTCDPDSTVHRVGLIKGGGEVTAYSGGIAYYYHNTLLQPPAAGRTYPMGAARPINSIGQLFYNFVSRNNILHSHKADSFRTINANCATSTPCTPPTPDNGPAIDFDLYNGRLQGVPTGSEASSITLGWASPSFGSGKADAIPTYANPGAVSWYPAVVPSDSNGWKGDFRLAANSKGISTLLTPLPNFNDQDSALHVGAQPPNKTEMKFGRAAAPLDDDPEPPSGAPAFRAASVASFGTGTIGFRAASTNATNTTSLSINVPAGTAANDVMIASIGLRPATASISTPSGWTLVRRVDNSGGVSLAVFHRVAGSGEPASHTWTLGGQTYAAGGIKSFSGVDTASPIDVENGQATPVSLSHATPSVTTTVANAMVVTAHTFATSTTWTAPAGMTEGFDVEFQPVPVNQGVSTEANYVAQAAAGATGTKTATAAGASGAEGWGATHILALRPAAPALAIGKPAGTVTDDVMIAAIGVRPHTASITAPSGWTLVQRVNNTGGISLAVYRKTAGGSEPASYTWGISGQTYAVAGIQSFSNVDTSNPINVEGGQTTPVSLSHATPSVTSTVANTMLVTAHTFATSTTWTPPSGMIEGFDVQVQPVPAGMGQALEGSYAVQAAAGATGAKTATAIGGSGDEGWGATHILVLRPAP